MPTKIIIRDEGAPAYMAQYTALMTILLAFFVFMSTMSNQQASGFKAGLGDVQNAFGIEGGCGLMNFTLFGKGGAHAPNPAETDAKFQGIHDNLLKSGSPGAGDTDIQVDDAGQSKYLRIKVPFDFPRFSSKISDQMRNYLRETGVGFALFDYKIQIRSFAEDSGDDSADRLLAIKRSIQIMRCLNQISGVPLSRMEASGCSSDRYFQPEKKDAGAGAGAETGKQGTFFYILVNTNKQNQTL
jgi:flagellar motor protein MotB